MTFEESQQEFTRQARELWHIPLSTRTRLLSSKYNFRPRKQLGQSFLVNDQAAERLAQLVGQLEPPGVAEIGGGMGALTVPLVLHLPKARLVVYEIDPVLCQVLADLLVPVARRCFVHCADFLTACPEQAGATDKWVLVGNLPYSLTTPILERIFFGRLRWRSVIVMVQREFADRLLASPGTRTYGSLTLFAQLHCQHIERVMELSPGSFWPQPKVSSAALQLTLRRQLPAFVVNPQYLSEVIRGAFNYRRKTLLRALTTAAPLGASAEQVRTAIEDAGLDPSHRPENLTLEDFAALAASLQRVTGSLG